MNKNQTQTSFLIVLWLFALVMGIPVVMEGGISAGILYGLAGIMIIADRYFLYSSFELNKRSLNFLKEYDIYLRRVANKFNEKISKLRKRRSRKK